MKKTAENGRGVWGVVFALLLLLPGRNAMAIEQPSYQVIQKDADFELRSYVSFAIAETEVTGTMNEAGNAAFRKLFRYIQGENKSQKDIAMTAPVALQANPKGETVAMTAPVTQSRSERGYLVSFTLPATFTADTAPTPNDSSIAIRQIPARQMAVIRYSGSWSESRYAEKKNALMQWITTRGFTAKGEPVLARYNSPFTLWFLRRNEVQMEVQK